MSYPIKSLARYEIPPLLTEIPKPPQTLTYRGCLPSPDTKLLAVVGSRRYTNYGKDAVEYLISGLRGYNVGIVSGLALGIDSLAHQAALDADLYTLAIPGGGLDDSVIYPARHKPLAHNILAAGGGLLSEYDATFRATAWSFPERNRLVCGLATATLVIEAEEKSGSLITARLAADYNRDLLVVPGSIFSKNSRGTHQFMKLGAILITTPGDILEALYIEKNEEIVLAAKTSSPVEDVVLAFLNEPRTQDEIVRHLKLETGDVTALLMSMEINNLIVASGDSYRLA